MINRNNNISPFTRLTARIEKFSEKIFIEQKLNNWPGYLLFMLLALGMGWVMAHNYLAGLGITGLILGVAVALTCMLNTEAGLYINMTYSFFIANFNRLLFYDELQIGVYSDLLVLITFLSFIIRRVSLQKSINKFTKAPVVVTLLVVYGYMAIELFNPNANFLAGWFPAFRKIMATLLILFICFNVFESRAALKRFITFLFFLVTAVAVYGCIQQWHGFFPFEMNWLAEDPKRFAMTFVAVGGRKMSTMPDAPALAIVMSTCSAFFIVLATGQRKLRTRIVMICGIILMLLAMSYSATRTANAMLVAGLVMFMLLTMNKKSTRIFAVGAVLAFLFLMYAPINSPQIDSFRQTFEGSNDASFNVREVNRKGIQPYIYAHPIGGGLGTTGAEGFTYNPGHPLAGFPPDSGYLKKALELGWIGFSLMVFLYFLVLKTGIRGHFSSKDEEIKLVYAAGTAAIFAFYVGDFSQVAIGQITDVFVYYPLIAVLLKAKEFDQSANTLTT
ncbi:MAG TPA: O-antigen ligase family protein [Puia sp.]|nr:O-antigen ligase family protein [Puia sp.]